MIRLRNAQALAQRRKKNQQRKENQLRGETKTYTSADVNIPEPLPEALPQAYSSRAHLYRGYVPYGR